MWKKRIEKKEKKIKREKARASVDEITFGEGMSSCAEPTEPARA